MSYYLDHQEEVDLLIADCRPEVLAQRYGFEVDERGRIVFEGT